MLHRVFFLILVLGLHSATLHAQKQIDRQLWPGISFKWDLPKKWVITTQYRFRQIDNWTYFKGSYFFTTIEYDFHPNFEAIANYRLALVDVGTFHRYFLGIAAKVKLAKKLSIQFRPAIQYQSQRFTNDDEIRLDADRYFRPRFTTKYTFSKKWDGYFYVEPFYAWTAKGLKIDNWQNSVGLKYELAKSLRLNPYFIWMPNYRSNRFFLTNYITGLDIEFTLKPFKKRKKNSAFLDKS